MGRPKGKARPASSSLAPASGNVGFGFGGYVGSTRIDAAGPSEDAILNIDGETAANFRRLSKKDPVTKLKALSALTTFFQESTAVEVAAVLPSWVFEYKKLIQDNNRQTRENTHKAMACIVSKVGRSLAPHLRSLMGPWWISHFDPFYEVSDAAKQALQVAFPGQKKRLEAITFCANDILTLIDENLRLTPQTISEKTTPIEESIEKHERVVSSSLFALSALMNVLLAKDSSNDDNAKKLVALLIKLFQEHRLFQNLVKSSSPRIRTAVYETLKAYIQYVPEVISSDNMESAAKLILGAFSEKDNICHQAMWDMILVFARSFNQAWECKGAKNVIKQRFWAFLRHACYGSQKISFPCLLPLLSLIPPAVVTPVNDFFTEFFTNLWRGREEGTWTYEEGLILLNSAKECFFWLVNNEERFSVEKGHLQSCLIQTVLMGLLWRTIMHEETVVLNKESLFQSEKFMEEIINCIVDILNFLDNELLGGFWTSLGEDCQELIRTDQIESIGRLLHFFVVLDSRIVSDENKRTSILNTVVKPLVSNSFSYVKEKEQPETLKLYTGLVSLYGPSVFEVLATKIWRGDNVVEAGEYIAQEAEGYTPQEIVKVFAMKHLHYLFRNHLLPWCLCVKEHSSKLKVELLLSFMEREEFFGEWEYALIYLEELEEDIRIHNLAVLIETLQVRCGVRKENDTVYVLERWKSSKIDEFVLSAACNGRLFEPSYYELVRIAVEGGFYSGSYYFILSNQTLVRICEQFRRNMLSAIYMSGNQSTALLMSFISPSEHQDLSTLEGAKAAVDIFLRCYHSLMYVDGTRDILAQILTNILVLHWTFLDHDDVEDEGNIFLEEVEGKEHGGLLKVLLQARKKMSSLCEEMQNGSSVYKTLIMGIKNAITEVTNYEQCAWWLLETLRSTCSRSEEDLQSAIDFLLAPTDYWPFWSTVHKDKNKLHPVEVHSRFSEMVHKISCSLGPEKVFLGSTKQGKERCTGSRRSWLIGELLCTWEYAGKYSENSVLQFLQFCAIREVGGPYRELLENVLEDLFDTVRMESQDKVRTYLSALLRVLRALFEGDGGFTREEAEKLFKDYLMGTDSHPGVKLDILPDVLDVLMPSISKGVSSDDSVESCLCSWLKFALNLPSLRLSTTNSETMEWMKVVIACFPLDVAGGPTALFAASKADVSPMRKNLLLFLLRKEIAAYTDSNDFEHMLEPPVELMVAKLVAICVAYNWRSFGIHEWSFTLGQTRKWIESGVLNFEEEAEAIAEKICEGEVDILPEDIPLNLLTTATNILSLLRGLKSLEETAESLDKVEWSNLETRSTENVLRIFLATGLTESISSTNESVRRQLSLRRLRQNILWDRIAEISLESSARARESAARAGDLWGLGKGSVSALYSLLFSPVPLPSLQWASFNFLCTEPLQHQAVSWKAVQKSDLQDDEQSDLDFQMEKVAEDIRPELLSVLRTSPSALAEAGLSSTLRAHYFLAWALFLSHLQILVTDSRARERLLQYTKDSNIPSVLLDCLLQHLPLKKQKGAVERSPVAQAATRSSSTGSVFFALEGFLWSGSCTDFAVLAGGLYGLMLKVLPGSVLTWFNGLRDKITVAGVEAFTADHCSRQLVSEQLNQVQAAAIADESLTIRANRSVREVVAVYKKEEAGMDIVLRLPTCYPLKAVQLDCTRRMGVSESLLRKCMLSMAAFLRNQNGSLSDAVLMWKKNVDREFEGVEECPICYSIIHTSNHTLPRLACKTCRHKFHGACLYKWFSSSHKSTCPLCQTPFY